MRHSVERDPILNGQLLTEMERRQSSDGVVAELSDLNQEQRDQLDRFVEDDSQAFFEFMQEAVQQIKMELIDMYNKGTSVNPEAVVELLIKNGISTNDALEAANTIVMAAKQAASPDQFTTLLDTQFNPTRRLPLTLQHWRERSPHSWYMATPMGRERLEEFLDRLD